MQAAELSICKILRRLIYVTGSCPIYNWVYWNIISVRTPYLSKRLKLLDIRKETVMLYISMNINIILSNVQRKVQESIFRISCFLSIIPIARQSFLIKKVKWFKKLHKSAFQASNKMIHFSFIWYFSTILPIILMREIH